MKIRLQKILSTAGIASRRKSEEIITAGRVTVNGETVRELGAKAAETDIICVDGKPITPNPQKIYLALHKPQKIITSANDQFARKTVLDLVPATPRLFPVGRLDYDTSGLIFLTNDGDWANALIHPRREIKKTYIATVEGVPTETALNTFKNGIIIEGIPTAPAEIEILTRNPTTLKITIHEGRNRQIRKMCQAIGHPVITLTRTQIGAVTLGDLPPGKHRPLTQEEIEGFII